MTNERWRSGYPVLHLAFVAATLAGGCNSAFGIHQGTPPPPCYDPTGLLIDDMEDGQGDICNLSGRQGDWYSFGDGTSTMLDPPEGGPFNPTMIDGGRGTSHYAARLTGSGFTGWGAGMGFSLDANQPYQASSVGGIQFWMKSNVAVYVSFDTPATETPATASVGACVDSATAWNCKNPFGYSISTPSSDGWVEYEVPFAALRQGTELDANQNTIGGSATWTPSSIMDIAFTSEAGWQTQAPGGAFETWVDDIRFYYCDGVSCLPTCDSDMVACPAIASTPAGCWPAGSTCSSDLYTSFVGVWGSGPDDVWAVGDKQIGGPGVIRHWNGSVWSSAPTAPSPNALWGLWESKQDDVWAVGDFGTVIHWDGLGWSSSATANQASLNSVWGSGGVDDNGNDNDIWAVGMNGTILHYDGSWSVIQSISNKALYHLWGSAQDDVWAVGDGGTILHYDGAAWSPSVSGTDSTLWGVWGSDRTNVYAVGNTATGDATILRWDGGAWSPVSTPALTNPNAVWGSGPDDVWVVGASILHWDGNAWSPVSSPTSDYLYTVWGTGPTDVWIGAAQGTVLHWDDSQTWSVVPVAGLQ